MNLSCSNKHHLQNPEKKYLGNLPMENVKMRLLRIFLLFIPLLYLDKRNGSECILIVASVSEGWNAAGYVQSYLLFGGRKRISTILIFQNRTEVILWILIGFDFRDLFLERAFVICMIIAILSVEQRKNNTT